MYVCVHVCVCVWVSECRSLLLLLLLLLLLQLLVVVIGGYFDLGHPVFKRAKNKYRKRVCKCLVKS